MGAGGCSGALEAQVGGNVDVVALDADVAHLGVVGVANGTER